MPPSMTANRCLGGIHRARLYPAGATQGPTRTPTKQHRQTTPTLSLKTQEGQGGELVLGPLANRIGTNQRPTSAHQSRLNFGSHHRCSCLGTPYRKRPAMTRGCHDMPKPVQQNPLPQGGERRTCQVVGPKITVVKESPYPPKLEPYTFPIAPKPTFPCHSFGRRLQYIPQRAQANFPMPFFGRRLHWKQVKQKSNNSNRRLIDRLYPAGATYRHSSGCCGCCFCYCCCCCCCRWCCSCRFILDRLHPTGATCMYCCCCCYCYCCLIMIFVLFLLCFR